MTVRRVLLLALVACLLITSPAHAYLDPGTGSMLLSAIIGVAAAVGLMLKLFWYRLVCLLRGKKAGLRPGAPEGPTAADE
jgi:hypothetical protein